MSAILTYIYGLVDPRTGQLRYVGKADDLGARLSKHLREAKRDTTTHKLAWIRGLLNDGIEPVILPLMQVPFDHWEDIERLLIKFLREQGYDLVNMADGGDGGATRRGHKRSPETIRKISEGQKRLWNDEHRQEWQQRAKTQWDTPEFRERQASGLTKPEVKAKTSKAQKSRWQSVDARSRQRQIGKANWDNPELAQQMRDNIRARWQDPEYRARQSEARRRAWARRKQSAEQPKGGYDAKFLLNR